MLDQAERDLKRRRFGRSAVISNLRPTGEPPTKLEWLYRKALLQLSIEGEEAARTTLAEIINDPDQTEEDGFLVDMAKEDLLALDLERAKRMKARGEFDQARTLLDEIIERHQQERDARRWVQSAREVLKKLPPRTTASDGDDVSQTAGSR